MSMGNLIKNKRIALGLTMKDVASAVGVSEATVSRWEAGEISNMRRNRISSLANVLNMSPLEIMENADSGDALNATSDFYSALLESPSLLGKKIKSYRKERHMSQRQFAASCGISNGYISMLEEGKNPKTQEPIIPSIPILKKIAIGLDVSLSNLICDMDEADSSLTKMPEFFNVPVDYLPGKEEIMDNLYEKITALCKSKGISGSRMCLELGLSKSTLSELKYGRTKGLTAITAQKIASYLGVTVGYLLGEEDSEKTDLMFETKNLMERIRELRRENKMTMKALGEEIGVSESTVSLYESGKRQPDYATLRKIAKLFGVTVDYLLGEPNDCCAFTAINDLDKILTKQESALLTLYKNLDVIKQAQLLAYAAELSQ